MLLCQATSIFFLVVHSLAGSPDMRACANKNSQSEYLGCRGQHTCFSHAFVCIRYVPERIEVSPSDWLGKISSCW